MITEGCWQQSDDEAEQLVDDDNEEFVHKLSGRNHCKLKAAQGYNIAGFEIFVAGNKLPDQKGRKPYAATAALHAKIGLKLLTTINVDYGLGSQEVTFKQGDEWTCGFAIGIQNCQVLMDMFKLPVWNPELFWAILLVTTLKHIANHAECLCAKRNNQADQRAVDILRIALNNLATEHTKPRERKAAENASIETTLIKQLPSCDDLGRVQQQLYHEMELLNAFCDEMGYTDLPNQNKALFNSSMRLMIYGFAICCKQGRPG